MVASSTTVRHSMRSSPSEDLEREAITQSAADAISSAILEKRTLRPRRETSRIIAPTQNTNEALESDLTPIESKTPLSPPTKSRQKTRRKDKFRHENEEVEVEALKIKAKSKKSKSKSKGKKHKVSQAEDDASSFVEEGPPKKKRKTRQPKPEPVYVIPDVEKKSTSFKGRLGYACLNTILRNKKPVHEAIFCSRTCRIDTIKKEGLDFVKDLGRRNAEDMLKIIEWNERNNIRFMRLSSEMFPFASHAIYGYSLTYCAPLLASIGALAAKYGHRLTTHPGQFTQLGSPREDVVEASIRELKYHCEMLDIMGIGPDGVMIVHGGGVYGDKDETLKRIKATIQRLPQNVRDRLVLENDELCYNAAELLPLCTELSVPLILDYHHDLLNPSPNLPPAAIIQQANAIFARRGIRPKQHLSEPRAGAVSIMERRAHADRCQALPEDLPDDMDLMIEAKDKEQAVLHLYRMYDLQPVIYESLRPPADKESKETKGRKSAKKARAKKEADAMIEEAEKEETGVVSDVEAETEALQTGLEIDDEEQSDAVLVEHGPSLDEGQTQNGAAEGGLKAEGIGREEMIEVETNVRETRGTKRQRSKQQEGHSKSLANVSGRNWKDKVVT
ncbi:hypothetical protein SERLA73DRAFT_107167 [Serpula lacrymans var. lacrymans S7.3]|uniref:UV-endonuclease UvdE n=1 Tax=Serpula lacrymans var. lacrymans (strain S7.3) TaxID=936435 RepID=F8PVN6_SERL3|nr:hypothetical protein SERLA73DRAFT_107167 [Serpula lacrymans var. lacrymans S7.3]